MKKCLLLGLVIMLAVSVVGIVGCGGKPGLSGTYIHEDDPESYLELKADGTFYVYYDPGLDFGTRTGFRVGLSGTYKVEGDTIILSSQSSGAAKLWIGANELRDEQDKRWVKEGRPAKEETLAPAKSTTPAPTTQKASADDIEWLATVIASEAGSIYDKDRWVRCTDEERAAVGWTVLNRLSSGTFGGTVKDVVTAPGQYATNQEPTSEIRALAKKLLEGRIPDAAGGAMHFFSPISMPKEGESTAGFDVGGGVHEVPGIAKKVYFPSWTKQLVWVGDLDNVRPSYFMFYRDTRILIQMPPGAVTRTRIAFVSNRDGNDEIYVMNADGTNQTRLTNNSADDWQPKWSPDGKKLAFESYRDGNDEIYVMNADGTNQTRLTNSSDQDNNPQWSPDGKKLAFVSGRDDDMEIYVMNADGTNQTRLTSSSGWDFLPVWSPDGKKVAFVSQRDGIHNIYVMNADGTNQTRLTNSSDQDNNPQWSPDGKKLAFDRFGNPRIYVMNADGSGQVCIATDGSYNSSLSPDGKKIAFVFYEDGNDNIYVMNTDGTNQTRLTSSSARDTLPVWSPDGRKIAFVSDRDGYTEIYVMNADGTNQTRLTNNSAYDSDQVWSPLN